ncbi:DEAD/DEAH box helicase [Aquibacillus sp. 3ASR75-11]|uniref:DEAD/DEAH box helicase n=1 Tax=Terrihalobacillus insolitus TaxID=2950438 RepID=A0A9X4AMS7_9BACI|nr:DEAD/DEAH box helicase [Terrihalobacillus insolitus]MDC3412705.1 DEAD/DEAH box helicase [Terrihalobacillus insolitus]MDC3423818.1 DEAD/DEAH box helicase [Terrihalobacillus insolitus]
MNNKLQDEKAFFSLMHPFLQRIWKRSNFTERTAIQREAIPLIFDGKDVIAESPTGSGKTLAYLLPLLQIMEENSKNVQVVILASSHELVMQIHQELQKWTEGSEFWSASLIGGASMKRQLEKLKKRPQFIVGTPGRIFELIKQKKLKMHEVKTIVLDEGDQLLVPEHKNEIQSIIKSTLSDRQVVLFSATLPQNIEDEAKSFMNNPKIIKIQEAKNQPNVEHVYVVCEQRDKIDVLRKMIRTEELKALVFVKEIGNLSVLAEKLQYKGSCVGVLHSDTKKQDRENAIKGFRSGIYPILLATDVAARGLDISDLTHVINLDLPKDVTQYVHRAGRTGRLGSASAGTVISIVTPYEARLLAKYGRKLGIIILKKELHKGKLIDARE